MKPSHAALDCGKAKSPVTAQIMNSNAEAEAAMYMVVGRASPLPNTRLDTTTTIARPKAENNASKRPASSRPPPWTLSASATPTSATTTAAPVLQENLSQPKAAT